MRPGRLTLVAVGCQPRGIEVAGVKTVLGLSVTSHRIAWALVDGRSTDVTALDDDAFEVDASDQLADRVAAAARSAQAIAATSGQDVAAIGVTWHGPDPAGTGDHLPELLDLLAAAGFDDVRVVSGQIGADDLDEDEAQVRDAQAAARAVATNAVAATSKLPRYRPPAPCKHRAARVVAAAAATVAAGMLTVGSQFTAPAPIPAADEGDVTAAAPAPRLVTVAAPRLSERAVTMLPNEEPVQVQVAERAERAPVEQPVEPVVAAHVTPTEQAAPVQLAQPVSVVQTAVPQAVPVVQMAIPAQAPTAASNMPTQQPAGAPAAHLPAVQPQLAVAEAHIAADPSPGPASASAPLAVPAPALAPAPLPAPAPAPVPPPDPISGWLLAAMP